MFQTKPILIKQLSFGWCCQVWVEMFKLEEQLDRLLFLVSDNNQIKTQWSGASPQWYIRARGGIKWRIAHNKDVSLWEEIVFLWNVSPWKAESLSSYQIFTMPAVDSLIKWYFTSCFSDKEILIRVAEMWQKVSSWNPSCGLSVGFCMFSLCLLEFPPGSLASLHDPKKHLYEIVQNCAIVHLQCCLSTDLSRFIAHLNLWQLGKAPFPMQAQKRMKQVWKMTKIKGNKHHCSQIPSYWKQTGFEETFSELGLFRRKCYAERDDRGD